MPTPDQPISVTELNRRARRALETEFPLTWVVGEVSNLARPASGHLYFTLKDASAQVHCAMFRSRAQLAPWKLENGDRVEAQGLVSLYEARGDFQLTIEAIRHAGQGRLFEAFLQLKTRLEAEGLFASERKQPLPRFPRAIGVVTSPQAAALQDVLAALARRCPQVPVVIYPTPVQGETAPAAIVTALKQAESRRDCDVVLLVRGGGSLEDLWAFNDEALARAIAALTIPVVSGIGHETDFTIADFVADLRGTTPTAAAELASAGWHDVGKHIDSSARNLQHAMQRIIDRSRQRVDDMAMRLIHPQARLQRTGDGLRLQRMRLDAAVRRLLQAGQTRIGGLAARIARERPDIGSYGERARHLDRRLSTAMHARLLDTRHRLERCADALLHLNPAATLERGYSIVRDQGGTIIVSARHVAVGSTVEIEMARGRLQATVASQTLSD